MKFVNPGECDINDQWLAPGLVLIIAEYLRRFTCSLKNEKKKVGEADYRIMKKKIIKFLGILMIVTIAGSGMTAKADTIEKAIVTDSTKGDQIIIKYRISNGILQYRHWNASRNCWVEPDWINV